MTMTKLRRLVQITETSDPVASFLHIYSLVVLIMIIYYNQKLDMQYRYPCTKLPSAILAGITKSQWGMACDTGLNGRPVTILAKKLKKVITVHAGTQIRYFIPEKKLRLKALAAIPDYIAGDGGGSVVFNIIANGRLVKSSGLVTYGNAFQFDVVIENSRDFILEVTDGGDGEFRDHAVWGDLEVELE